MIDTREYIDALRGLVEEGREVSMVIAGSSMSPFLIHKRDVICFRSPDRSFRTGDMVFYLRDNGRYVMHRICRVRPEGYYLVGDAQTAALDEQGLTLMEYVKQTFSYQSDRVSKALAELTGKEDDDA